MSKKIESMSKGQWDQIPGIRQKYIDLESTPLDEELSTYWIGELYKACGLKKPKVLFFDDPAQMNVHASLCKRSIKPPKKNQIETRLKEHLRNYLRGQLRDQIEDRLRVHLWSQLPSLIWDQVGDQMGGQLKDQMEDPLRGHKWTQMGDQLGEKLGGQLREKLGGQLRGKLERQLGDQLERQLGDQLEEKLGGQLRGKLEDELEDQLERQLGDQLGGLIWDQLMGQLGGQLEGHVFSQWLSSYLSWFNGAVIAGVEFEEELYCLYKGYLENVSLILPFETTVFACRRPTKIQWQDRLLHCEDGMAVQYPSGWGWYSLQGYRVPEKLVTSPESQTIEEINAEENEEIKRIRIERYGWTKYLTDSNAQVLDLSVIKPPYGKSWMESLMYLPGQKQGQGKSQDIKVLVTYDPSTPHTGRKYALEVNLSCNTCADAQRYLLSPEEALDGMGIDLNTVETYPLLRT